MSLNRLNPAADLTQDGGRGQLNETLDLMAAAIRKLQSDSAATSEQIFNLSTGLFEDLADSIRGSSANCAFEMHLTAATSQVFTSGTPEAIIWNSGGTPARAVELGGTWWSASNPSYITFPLAGTYIVSICAFNSSSSATGIRQVWLQKVGVSTALYRGSTSQGVATYETAQTTFIVTTAEDNESWQVLYLQTSGVNKECSGGTDYATVARTSIRARMLA